MNKPKKLIFGVFTKGELVFAFNTILCTEKQAEIIVNILDQASEALLPGHYFAYDYAK